jgi:phosphate-selective porin OprO/OprP
MTAAWLGLATALPAAADPQTDAKIEALEAQMESLRTQIADLKVATSSRLTETQRQIKATTPSLSNGRVALTSADGAFTAALRSLVQYDAGYYDQDKSGAATDLSSGTNFRRARYGFEGKVFTDFEYSFVYDLGGSGVEGASISNAYVQYNGFAPFAVRVGAFPPFANLEDSSGAAETLFLERASVTEIQRGLAGGDGRSAISIVRPGERFFGSLAYTGGRDHQSNIIDEQQALLGRAAYLLHSTPGSKLVVGMNGTSIFEPADTNPKLTTAIALANATELRVDTTGNNGAPTSLVSTGLLNAHQVTQWGIDAGGNWRNFYAEGGYYAFDVERKLAQPDAEFDGWYGAVSWVITGEPRRYDPARASFRSPTVLHPIGAPGAQGITPTGPITNGWGAWEVALRYSTIDLDDHVFDPIATNRVRGGSQDIWTLGLNWYLNNAVKVQLNYQNVNVDRLNASGASIDQDLDQVSMRLQFAL